MDNKEQLLQNRSEAAQVIEELRDQLTGENPQFDEHQETRWQKANEAYDAADAALAKLGRADEIKAAQEVRDSVEILDSIEGAEAHESREGKAAKDAKRIQEMRDESGNFKLGSTRDFRALQTESRAQSTTTTAGGYTIPEGFVPNLEKAMLHFGPMLQVADVIRTDSGNDLPWPTVNDTSNSGALLAENTQDSEQDVTFGQFVLNAYKYTSKIVRVSNELMEDSAFDMGAELGALLGERLGRAGNTAFTTGTGSSQPNGIVTASAAGVTAAATGAITFDEVIDLEHSVDIAYRSNAQFMMNDATLKLIRQLKDSNGMYLWSAPVNGLPGLIGNHSYLVNNDMATAAANAKTIVFGDLSKYKIRQVNDVRLVRMDERYADYDQVAFVALVRWDGDLLDAGVDPVKHLVQAAA